VKVSDTVTVHATGIVKGGKKFWSTRDPGQNPFTYQAGVGKVSPHPKSPQCMGPSTADFVDS